jgi:hypothetical protein
MSVLIGGALSVPAQQANPSTDNVKAPNSPVPSSPPNLALPRIPTPEEVQASQGPQLIAAPLAPAPNSTEKGFPNLPATAGTFAVSEHDSDEGQDIVKDLIGDAVRKQQGLDDPSSFQSAVTDALAAGSEKLGNVTSNEFLQKTFPSIMKSELFSSALSGAGVLLDSEPIDSNHDSPDPVSSTQSAILNLGRVATGEASPFNDANLMAACNRLRSTYDQNRFGLNGTEQSQVTTVLGWCQQAINSSNQVQPTTSVTPARTLPPVPPQQSSPPKNNDCPPHAKACR